MMADVASAIAEDNQIMDIELPVAPGVDWIGVLQWLGLFSLTIMILLLLFWVLTHVWFRLRIQLQLRYLLRRLARTNQTDDSQKISYRAYQLFVMAQRHQLIATPVEVDLAAKINQACFSKAVVSRETTRLFLQQFDQALTASRPRISEIFKAGCQSWLSRIRFLKGQGND